MTDTQFYLAVGLPVFAILISVLVGMLQFTALGARLTSLEASVNSRFTGLESTVNSRFSSLEGRFEVLTGKVVEIDNRLTRLEAILERH